MAKKSFKDTANNNMDKFFTGAEKTPEVQEVQERQEAQQTQGKKGAKMQRINMAFTPSNIDFIRVMAKIKGQTMTQFVNEILDNQRQEVGEVYEQAKKLVDSL